jgi:hypothetical protein
MWKIVSMKFTFVLVGTQRSEKNILGLSYGLTTAGDLTLLAHVIAPGSVTSFYADINLHCV